MSFMSGYSNLIDMKMSIERGTNAANNWMICLWNGEAALHCPCMKSSLQYSKFFNYIIKQLFTLRH